MNIAFFEPAYTTRNQRDWEIRGSYKYPSLLGNLHEQAGITLLMREIPPADDPHRVRLEEHHGVSFAGIASLEDPREHAAETLAEAYADAIAVHKPDIVSTLNGRMIGFNFALARAARKSDIDFVYRVAGNDIVTRISVFAKQGRPFENTALWAGLVAQERVAAEVARSIIVMGGTEKHRVEALVSDPSKVQICQRGVELPHFSPAGNAPKKCKRFLFLGRNSAEKGIDLLEEAAAILADNNPDIRFTLAGDFEARESANISYRGFSTFSELPALYQSHDALILPARSEGFPQVVMEAMACGLPAILSRHLFAHDLADCAAVKLVELDSAQIAAAAQELHADGDKYSAMREAALLYAQRHFDAEKNRKLYYRALLGAGS